MLLVSCPAWNIGGFVLQKQRISGRADADCALQSVVKDTDYLGCNHGDLPEKLLTYVESNSELYASSSSMFKL